MYQHNPTQAGGGPVWEAHVMESVLLSMRQIWFGASVTPLHGGLLVSEPEGQLITMIRADATQVSRLLTEARARRAYVVATPYSLPGDLLIRLRRAGFQVIQKQGTYIYEGALLSDTDLIPGPPGSRRGLLRWLPPKKPLPISIDPIDGAGLESWNRVCWQAFSPRGVSEAQSLAEKRRAFRTMGPHANWYLASCEGRPVGTAILYQGEQAAQILAVGTLAGFRGRGIATAMVRRAIYDWQRGGWGFLFLDTLPGGPAERLYLSFGFRQAYVRRVFAP